MELQLLEEADFDDLYAETLPNSAYVDERHPMGAAYKTYPALKYPQLEPGGAGIVQSTLTEGEYEELSCIPFSWVYLTFIIDAIERYLY